MLEIPGTETEPGGTLAQSAVIVRALAQRLGLDGRNTDPNNTPLASIHVGEVSLLALVQVPHESKFTGKRVLPGGHVVRNYQRTVQATQSVG